MAICTFGPIVGAVRGSLGGVTFTGSSGGPAIKPRRKPSGRKTKWTLSAHAALQATHTAWLALSDDHRAIYSTMASQIQRTNALGLSKPMSPQGAFFSHVLKYFAATNPLEPYLPSLGPTQAYTFGYVRTSAGNVLRIRLDRSAPYTDTDVFVYFTTSMSASHRPYRKPVLLDFYESTSAAAFFNFYFSDEVLARIGTTPTGSTWRIEILCLEPNRWASPLLAADGIFGTEYTP